MINRWLYGIDHSAMGTAIRQSPWLFPLIETFHLFGIVSLVASTSILDLRLLGAGPLRHWPASKLTQAVSAVGLVGLCGPTGFRSADDQFRVAEELPQSCVSPEDTADRAGGREFLVVSCHVLPARRGMGTRPPSAPGGSSGGIAFFVTLVWNCRRRALYSLLLNGFRRMHLTIPIMGKVSNPCIS